MTSAKSKSALALRMPYFEALRIWLRTRAVLISALEGTQPVLRQSPPMRSRSMSVFTLIERERMGGDCLNTGCVPSKALIKTARVLSQIRNASKYGIRSASADFDFAEVMERLRRVVRAIG